MRNANTEIVPLIMKKTLALLMKNNPEQISMREIAKECGVTATLIYHYFSDKTQLFQAIGLDCILKLNDIITAAAKKEEHPKEKCIAAASAFRDWCFENPRKALLVMSGIASKDDGPEDYVEQFYACNRTGERLLQEAVDCGQAHSKNVELDIGILVSGLWGCCEAVILKKSSTAYWNNGIAFTDRFIQLWAKDVFTY